MSLFPFHSGLDKIPFLPLLPKMEPRNPDREVKWPNKIKQSKTCQGQDRPRGAGQPNKWSRSSLNLFHWFADRGSLAPRKKTIHSGHRSPSARCILKHLIKHLRLGESYYNHNSINLIHHLYITGLYIWLCCHIIFTHTHTLSLRLFKKYPFTRSAGSHIFKKKHRDI